MLGRWLCNLGWHQPRRNGRMEGEKITYAITETQTTSLSYLRCQRCGVLYHGSVLLPEQRRFP